MRCGITVELTGRRTTNQASESSEWKTTLLRSGPTICYPAPDCKVQPIRRITRARRVHKCHPTTAAAFAKTNARDSSDVPSKRITRLHCTFSFQMRCGITVELTGRRTTNQASESCERKTTLLRSGPTICYAAPKCNAPNHSTRCRGRDRVPALYNRSLVSSRAMVATSTTKRT
jgi:hypothetical protein